jgi:serine/threonine-protein kinase
MILAIIFAVIVVLLLSIILIIPAFTKVPDVTVPDVSGLTVVNAEKKLKKSGFEVALETVKEENGKVEKGKVIKTEPQAERTIKKGSTITIYESLGEETYTVEDYTGSNYIEIQTLLVNMYGLEVKIEKQDVDSSTNYGEQEIISQSVKAGTVLGKGDKITLYIPNVLEGYPDMVAEGWSVNDVEEFCAKYELKCKINYDTNTNEEEGTILSQSRSPKSTIAKGASFAVTFAKKAANTTDGDNITGPSSEVDSSSTSTSTSTNKQ